MRAEKLLGHGCHISMSFLTCLVGVRCEKPRWVRAFCMDDSVHEPMG